MSDRYKTTVFNARNYDGGMPLGAFISKLNNLSNGLTPDQADTLFVYIDDDYETGLTMHVEREETDAEAAEREKAEASQRSEIKSRRRAQYERLKAEFESEE